MNNKTQPTQPITTLAIIKPDANGVIIVSETGLGLLLVLNPS